MSPSVPLFISLFIDGKCTRESLNALLHCSTIDINMKVDELGNTPLTLLCKQLHDTKRYRLNMWSERVTDCLAIVCQSPRVNVNAKVDDRTPAAIYLVDNFLPLTAVNHIVNNATFNPNAVGEHNMTLFHAALIAGHWEVAERLLECDGIDLSIRPTQPSAYIPLIVAVDLTAPKVVAALLQLPSTNINEGGNITDANDTWPFAYERRVLPMCAQKSWLLTTQMSLDWESCVVAMHETELVAKMILDREELDVNAGEPMILVQELQPSFVKQLWGKHMFDIHRMETKAE